MALEQEVDGTAQTELGTAQNTQAQTPAQAGTAPATTAQTPAPDVEKELQRIRSESGRQLAAARREAEQARQAAEQARQQTRQLQMRDMSDAERLQFERDEAIAYAQQTNQVLATTRQEQDRLADLQEIAEKTGAPMEELQQATSFKNAWEIGVEHLRKQTTTAKAATVEREEANAVYLGGGAPSTPLSRHEMAVQKAVADGDPVAYVRLLREGKKVK